MNGMYDFGDGLGPAPAHRHPNGSGWVADTVYIEKSVFVDRNARVFGNAQVFDCAQIFGNAQVFDCAQIFGNAQVFDCAQISGNAQVFGHARVFGHAQVFDCAQVFDYAQVFGHAQVFDCAQISGNAQVFNYVQIFGHARVFGNAQVLGNAVVNKSMYVSFGLVDKDLSARENLVSSIAAQCNLGVVDGYVYCYKRVFNVRGTLRSEHDPSFIYPEKGVVECKSYDLDPNKSCSEGLHFSHMSYYPCDSTGKYKTLFARVKLEDIITCLSGKIRVKKAEILGVCD